MEHKEQGIKALSILKSKSSSPEADDSRPETRIEATAASSTSRTGLECLEELCSISQNIEKDLQLQTDHQAWKQRQRLREKSDARTEVKRESRSSCDNDKPFQENNSVQEQDKENNEVGFTSNKGAGCF